ncbi:MAG: MGMT family protein [Anaerolineaceae bacterium]|nr:MGMT family protein [Anaerolineaceae bacterium]
MVSGNELNTPTLYERIYAAIREVPEGKVATYGQIAKIAGKCSPRNVGYALAALKSGTGIPWHRIINAQGKVSMRDSMGQDIQKGLLKAEGIAFDAKDRIDLKKFRWQNPV